jgi:RNA polymerase sigma-70 factor (ECF subfamily)
MDRELVERAQRGDREAYETLARDSARRLFLVCHRVLRDTDLAEDAVQRTLVAIWRELPGLRDPDRFDAWTYRMAMRFSLTEARRDRRMGGSVQLLPNDPPEAPDELAALYDRDALERGFRRLSPDHRAVVVLRYFVGLSLEEIGGVVGAPTGTVASRLHYALRDLRTALEADDGVVHARKGVPA